MSCILFLADTLAHSEHLAPSLSYDWRDHGNGQTEVITHVLDEGVLARLENDGFSLSQMLNGTKVASQTAELFKDNGLFRGFANVIGQSLPHNSKTDQLPASIPANSGDIPEMVRLLRNFEDQGKRSDKDLKGGYFIHYLSNNSQYPYSIEHDGDEPRHFDFRWLNSKFGYFKLMAIVNRIDRLDFDSNSCGEVRLIYRLSYKSPKSSSSLPFFVNVVNAYPKQANCSSFSHGFNRQELPFSPHSYSESTRRTAYARKLADGLKPNTFRPHSNFSSATWSDEHAPKFDSLSVGQLCILDQRQFANAPGCGGNTICKNTMAVKGQNVLFGECVNVTDARAGRVCWQGEITENLLFPKDRGSIPAYNLFAFQD